MNLILFMIIIAGTLSFVFVGTYLWAISSGQFDDLDTPALRILKHENKILNKKEGKGTTNEQQ